jgi:hypothetical protein
LNPQVLGIAPRFDEASEYSFKWFMNLVNQVAGKVDLDALLEDNATRANVEKALGFKKYDAILFYNHGNEDGLIAQGGNDYVLDRNNIELTRSSTGFIYAMACLAGKGYGVTWWQRGGVFIGYTEVFGFEPDEEKLFETAAGSGFIAWAEGERDWKRIKEIMIETFNDMISKAKTAWSKIWLTHDRDALVVYDGEAPKSSTCPLRRIALRLFGAKGWRLRSISLFKNLYWYDLWHMFLGLLTGYLWRTIWGPAIFTVYLVYQVTEKERDIQTVRDLLLYLVTVILGMRW